MEKEPAIIETAISEVSDVSTLPVTIDIASNLPVIAQPDYPHFVEEWILFTKKHSGLKSAQSERTYRNAIKQLVNYFDEQGTNIFTATDDDVYNWLETLKKEKSPSTVQLYLVAARLFFAFLHKQKIIAANPCEGMKAGVSVNREHKRDYLSVARVQEMLAAMPATTEMELRNRAVVALMVTSGLRCCEVQKAQYGDIKTAGDSAVLYIQGKGRSAKDSYVKISPSTGKMIQEYLAVRFGGRRQPRENDYLFVSTSRNHTADHDDELSTQTIRAIAKKAMKAIGFDDSRHTAHSFRHTAATLGLRAGKELTEVQQMMRHANVQTTLIYSHALEREKNDTENCIDALIFGKK